MTRVKMKCEALGVKEFNIDHAERLLAYQAKFKFNDWQLSDPNFTFDGIIKRTNTGASQKPKKQSRNTESD